MKVKCSKAFTLVEIVIAVLIFSFIVIWILDIFKNIANEKRIAMEKSKIEENINLFEKTLNNFINDSNLEMNMNLVDFMNSNFDQIRPFFVPSAVIVPAIYEIQSRRLILYQNRPQINFLLVQSQNNNQIVFSSINTPNAMRFRVIPNNLNNNGRFLCYFTLNGQLNGNINNVINFGNPSWTRHSYRIGLIFRRIPITNANGSINPDVQDIIFQTYGNITNINQINDPNITLLTHPNLLYAEVRVVVYNQNNIRRFTYSRVLNFYVRHKSII